MMEAQVRHLMQTPSFALTLVGYLALALHAAQLRRMDTLAFITLGLAGAGTVIALQGEVRDKQLEWGWMGIAKALCHPSKRFLISFSTHLPQLITAVFLALSWRGSREKV